MYDTYIRSLLSLDGRQTSSLNMKLEGIEQDLPLIAESTSHFPVNHVTNCTCVSQPLVIVCSRLAHCFHFITLLPASRRCSDTPFFFFYTSPLTLPANIPSIITREMHTGESIRTSCLTVELERLEAAEMNDCWVDVQRETVYA